MSPYETELAEAQKAHNRKDHNRSVAILRKILKRSPSCFPAEHMLAKIEFERGNAKLAKKSFASAIERAKEAQAPAEIILTLLTDYAYMLSTSGDYGGSNEVAKQGLELRADSPQLLFFKTYNLRNLEMFGEAVSVADRLLSLDSRNPDALCERGQIYVGLDRDEEALDDFRRAADLAPKFSYAYYGQAEVHLRKKRYDEALELCKTALSLNPFYAEAYTLVAACLLKLEGSYNEATGARLAQALDSYDKAIELKPDYAEAYSNRGNTLNELGRLDEALASHNKAIELKPNLAEAYSSRGKTLKDLGRLDDALASCNKAIELKPDYAEAYSDRGLTLKELGQQDEALASYNKAIELKPSLAEVYSNRAATLNDLGRLDEALASCNKAIELKPDYAEAYGNRGLTLRELGRLDEALSAFDKAINLKEGLHNAHYNKAWSLLQRGDFENGLNEYEWRPWNQSFPAVAKYTGGEPIAGKRILVGHELYFGDTIQFCRYAKMLIELGAHVNFAPQRRIARLISSMDKELNVVGMDVRAADYDYYVRMMSLPFIFRTQLDSVPNEVPYLFADERTRLRWLKRLGGEGFKVAVCWKGSDSLPGRSFPLGQLIGLSRIPGMRFISLQKGEGVEEIPLLSQEMQVEDFGDELDNGEHGFLDTAAIMKCCDLVITCDTAAAHLAGALGVPVWVALRQYAEWRWLLDRDDSPWYPTMRLFRQRRDGEWNSVFEEMHRALVEEMARR